MEFQPSFTDEELLLRAKNGDTDAFALLYDKYYDDLFQLAYKRTRSKEDTQDIVQDLFLSFWYALPGFRETQNLGVYLYVSLRNALFNYYEKKDTRFRHLLRQPFHATQSEDTILSRIRTKEIRDCVERVVTAMPEKMRTVYRMSREQHLTIEEIASCLELSPQTVKNQVSTALHRIRLQLTKENLAHLFVFSFFFPWL